MNIILYFIIISSITSIAFSVESSNLISIDHYVSPDSINIKGSADPILGSAILEITGAGNIPRKNVDAVLVMDISNSMGDLNSTKKAAIKVIAGLDKAKDKLGFVAFNSTFGPFMNPNSNFEDVLRVINETQTEIKSEKGDTCLSIGLKKAIELLSKEENENLKVIIFLSDGNNSTCWNIKDNPCADAKVAKDSDILIYSIGLNDAGNGTKYLKCIANATGGNYYSSSDSDLERILENISKNLPYIMAKNVVVKYAVPKSFDIEMKDALGYDLVEKLDTENRTELTIRIGTISSRENPPIHFALSSSEKGSYEIGIDPYSTIRYLELNGSQGSKKIPAKTINIKESTPINPDSTGTEKEEDLRSGSNFRLIGSGNTIEIVQPITGIKLRKIIEKNETSNLPKIVIQIITPPVKYADFVLAVDSSGSMVDDNRQEAIKNAIPKFLEKFNGKKNLKANISIISWNDKLGFVYGNNDSGDGLKLVPLEKSIEDVRDLFRDKYYCNETYATLFDEGLRPSTEILKSNPSSGENNTTRFIIFVVGGPSEFKNCSASTLNDIIDHGYRIGVVGVGVETNSYMYTVLNNLAKSTGGAITNSSFQQGDLAGQLADELNLLSEELLDGSIVDHVEIVDTLYPYLIPDIKSIEGATLEPKGSFENSDGSHTLKLLINNGLKPNSTWNISFDFKVNLKLPVEVERTKRSNVRYDLDESTPNSIVAYDWKLDEKPIKYVMDLPESEINLENDVSTINQLEPSKSNPKKTSFESGFIALVCILFLSIRRRF